MAHSVSGYVLYVSMWFNTKFVRVPEYLANRFDEEVFRLIKKKDKQVIDAYTAVEEILIEDLYEVDNELLIENIEPFEYTGIVPETDLLLCEVYEKERGLRIEFLGIQLDEMWTSVGNKENKQ